MTILTPSIATCSGVEPTTHAAFCPDDKGLATTSHDKTAPVWDVPSSSEVARMTHEGDVNEVAFSPDVKYLATASDDKTACVQVWQPEGHIE
jgi:WD40 repeat protein